MNAEDLPEGWTTANLLDLVGSDGLMSDGDWIESKDQDPLGDVRLIQLADIGDGVYLDRSNRFLTSSKAQQLQCTFLKPGDVLIARMPDPLGRACIFPGDTKQSVTAVDVCIFRSGSLGVDQGWLMHMVNSPAVRGKIASFATGTTRRRISGKNLKCIGVPVAPLDEQRRIADKIDELFSDIEQGEAALRRAKALLQRYRQAVLKAAVTGELTRDWRTRHQGEIETGEQVLARILEARRAAWEKAELAKMAAKGRRPKDDSWKHRYKEPVPPDTDDRPELPEGWVWGTVDQVSIAVDYGTSAKCGRANGVPVLRMGNIVDGELRAEDLKYLPSDHHEFPAMLLKKGDLLFNRTNSSELVGKSCVYDGRFERCSFASYLIRVRTTGVNSRFLTFYINSGFGRAWVREVVSQQVGQANVNGSKLKRLSLPIPARPEQDEIVQRADALLMEVDRGCGVIEEQARVSAALRQSILKAAFAGKLVPQDPDDEPASVLLERIAAERAAMKSAGRPRGRKRKREEPEKVAERVPVWEPVLG